MEKAILQYRKKAIAYRGEILHLMSDLDMGLNLYITYYFCGVDKERFDDMIYLILGDDRMSLGAKAQVFYFLATSYDEKWYNSYKSTRIPDRKKPPYSMNSDLVYIIEQRNIFAHRVIDEGEFSGESNPIPLDAVRFSRFKNSKELIDYDTKRFSDLVDLITNVKRHLFNKLELKIPKTM